MYEDYEVERCILTFLIMQVTIYLGDSGYVQRSMRLCRNIGLTRKELSSE